MQAVKAVRARTDHQPQVAMVLGSGLSSLADRVGDADIIPFAEIEGFPHSTVKGHSGRLVLGELAGVTVAIMQGRVHFYEGYAPAEITFPIRVLRLLGCETFIVTNAAGGLRPDFRPGDLMAINDHINLVGLAGHHPLRGPNEESFGPRFPDMARAYDPQLLEMLEEEAQAQNISLYKGVYVMVAGPSFETPAEVRYLRSIGADAVGMSTAPEVVVARHGGMRVLGVSLISNVAIDTIDPERAIEATHEEVLEAGARAVPKLASLLEGVLRRLASTES
jgi:purine-nucleoside phosphorylase